MKVQIMHHYVLLTIAQEWFVEVARVEKSQPKQRSCDKQIIDLQYFDN